MSTDPDKLRGNAVRVGVFLAVTALLATVIGATFSKAQVGPHETYRALFTDVSGLTKGSDVRAAGVSVGRVEDLELRDGNEVLVTFSVADNVPLTSGSRAQVRYANLTGDRFLELSRGGGSELAAGATLPAAQTAGALDLDTLFNGFKPLTRALNPAQVNELTGSLIAVSQGQGEALSGLLAKVASLTGTLADHDELIGQVIDNLSAVLGTVDSHRGDLGRLLDGLADLTDGLADDRKVIAASLADIDKLAAQSADLLTDVRPDLRANIVAAQKMTATFNRRGDFAAHYLSITPDLIRAMGRAGAYGSFFNFYLCGVRFKLAGGDSPSFSDWVMDPERRCQG